MAKTIDDTVSDKKAPKKEISFQEYVNNSFLEVLGKYQQNHKKEFNPQMILPIYMTALFQGLEQYGLIAPAQYGHDSSYAKTSPEQVSAMGSKDVYSNVTPVSKNQFTAPQRKTLPESYNRAA